MKKILIADDEVDILKVLVFRMKKAGYEILTAYNGEEALNILNKEQIDLVLLDLRMPILDGAAVFKIMKSSDNLKNIPIILLSANSPTELENKAKELGTEHYQLKPFDYNELLQKIKEIL